MTEEPLHVRTARLLGWTEIRAIHQVVGSETPTPETWTYYRGIRPNPDPSDRPTDVPDFERTGWAEILERERYGLYFDGGVWRATERMEFIEYEGVDEGEWEEAPAPGEAVCKLFVRLHAEEAK